MIQPLTWITTVEIDGLEKHNASAIKADSMKMIIRHLLIGLCCVRFLRLQTYLSNLAQFLCFSRPKYFHVSVAWLPRLTHKRYMKHATKFKPY